MAEEAASGGTGSLVRVAISAAIAVAFFVWVYSAWPRPEPGLGKIGFDLSQLDDDGLYGPPDGKVARMYEFCVPDIPADRETVRTIDNTVEFSGASGRIGCTGGEVLAIGSTAQRDWLGVLTRLSGLEFVERIEPFWGE